MSTNRARAPDPRAIHHEDEEKEKKEAAPETVQQKMEKDENFNPFQGPDILVVDSDSQYLNNLKNDDSVTSVSPYCANSLAMAKQRVEEDEKPILAVFVNTSVGEGLDWISVVESAHKSKPGIPIFLVEMTRTGLTRDEIKGLGVRRSLGRRLDLKKMAEMVGPYTSGFNIQGALEKAKQNKDSVGGVSNYGSEEFVPLRAENFLSGSNCIFDVYVRLSETKFVKILQAGDSFDLDRLENYMKKGVTHFYIKKEMQETYLEYCNHLTSRILKSKKLPVQLKVAQTLNQGDETMKFIKQNGVTKTSMKHAASYVSSVQDLYRQFNPKKHGLLTEFMNDIGTYDHGVATASIASLVTKHLGLDTHQAQNIVGVAALMHDIGLVQMPESVKTEDESRMTESEVALYHTHPKEGADAVSKIPGLPPAIAQAIAQHHVRRNKMGFPDDLASANRTLVSEIVGIADEFAKAIAEQNKNPELDPIKKMEEEIYQGFTKPIVDAFKTEFSPGLG